MARRRRKNAPEGEEQKPIPVQEETTDSEVSRRGDGVVTEEDRIIAEYKDRIKNPISGIRAHCVECFGGAPRAVAGCTSTGCSLYPFRMGKNTLHSKHIAAQKDKE